MLLPACLTPVQAALGSGRELVMTQRGHVVAVFPFAPLKATRPLFNELPTADFWAPPSRLLWASSEDAK